MRRPRARHSIGPAPLIATAIGSAGAFGAVATLVAKQKTKKLDGRVRAKIGQRHPRAARATVTALGYTGKPWVHGPLSSMIATYVANRGSKDGARAINLASTLAATASKTFDWTLKHRRPPPGRHEPSEPSFPSGHTLETAAVSLVAAYVLWREGHADGRVAFPIAAAIPLLEGGGRLYLDRHWTTDVVAGLAAGLAIAAACAAGYEARTDPNRKK